MDFCGSSLGSHPEPCYLVAEHVVQEASRKMAIKKKKKRKMAIIIKAGPFFFSQSQIDSWILMIQWREGGSVIVSNIHSFSLAKLCYWRQLYLAWKKKYITWSFSHVYGG